MNAIVVQIIITFFLSIPSILVAVANSWTSYALPILESEESPLGYKITKYDGNLLSSVVMLGSLTSTIFVGYISDKIGRKRTEMLCGLCYALGWSLITTSKTVTQLLIGRYIMGLGTGLHFVTAMVYVVEITQASIRGALLTIFPFVHNIGSLISYTEGWFCGYDVINYLNLTLAVGFVLTMSCFKETPIYLLRTGKEKEAVNSLMFYRGASTVTQEILDEIVCMRSQLSHDTNIDETNLKTTQLLENEKEKLNQEKEIVYEGITEQKSVWNILRTSKSAQRALIILIVNMNLSVCMGMIAVQAYAGQFFSQAAPNLSPHLCSVILAVVITIACGMSVFIINIMPRRVLMISSCLSSAACMACMATMLRWSWAPEWGIPLVMVFFSVLFHLGAVNIPFVQIGECLPPQINSFGSGIVMSSMFITCFIVLFVFKPAVDAFGLDGVFLLFSIIGILTATTVFFTMRETRKVPFEVVQNSFEQGYLYR